MTRVLTFGVFDYFHLGHLRLFKQAREYGDYLIVAVQDDRYIREYKQGANLLYSIEERVEILEAIRIVDRVIVYDRVDADSLELIDFDILALGEDHIGYRFDRIKEWCGLYGKEVVHLKRTHGISSSDIKKRLMEDI